MKRFLAKLAFVHRRLWQRNGTYRAAILVGPSPLFGTAAAAGLWYGIHALEGPKTLSGAGLPWAQARAPVAPGATSVVVAKPALSLPRMQGDGSFVGYASGWRGSIHPITVAPTLDVDVSPTEVNGFTVPGTEFGMDPILLAGEATGRALYVGVGEAMLAVTTAGTYGIGLHVERFGGGRATCLARLVVGGRRVVSNLNIGFHDAAHEYAPADFDLQPGLYTLAVAFGCWRDGRMAGPGRVTVMLRRPNEGAAQPIRPIELVRPAS